MGEFKKENKNLKEQLKTVRRENTIQEQRVKDLEAQKLSLDEELVSISCQYGLLKIYLKEGDSLKTNYETVKKKLEEIMRENLRLKETVRELNNKIRIMTTEQDEDQIRHTRLYKLAEEKFGEPFIKLWELVDRVQK